jgi:hypothetical protein
LAYAGANDRGGQQPPQGSTILNGQLTLGTQWSTLNTKINGVAGDVVIQSQGAGNTFEAVTFDSTLVNNFQDTESTTIGATVNATVSNVGGGVGVSGLAVCNAADISTDPAVSDVSSGQVCHAKDPSSEVNANVRAVTGDVAVRSAAFGNSYSEDTNAVNARTSLNQTNASNVFGSANTSVRNVGGSVAVTSSAVGNSAQVVHYSTSP